MQLKSTYGPLLVCSVQCLSCACGFFSVLKMARLRHLMVASKVLISQKLSSCYPSIFGCMVEALSTDLIMYSMVFSV
jgi:hypothetical protein